MREINNILQSLRRLCEGSEEEMTVADRVIEIVSNQFDKEVSPDTTFESLDADDHDMTSILGDLMNDFDSETHEEGKLEELDNISDSTYRKIMNGRVSDLIDVVENLLPNWRGRKVKKTIEQEVLYIFRHYIDPKSTRYWGPGSEVDGDTKLSYFGTIDDEALRPIWGEFHIEFSDKDIRGMETINDVIKLVKERAKDWEKYDVIPVE